MKPDLLTQSLERLAIVSLQAGALVLLVLVARQLLRGRLTPRWRHALWFIVVARLLLPVSFQSPTSLFNLVPRRAPVLVPQTEPLSAPAPAPEPDPPLRPLEVSRETSPAEPAQSIARTPLASAPTAPGPAQVGVARGSIPVLGILGGLWLTGAALLLAMVVGSTRRTNRRLRDAREVADPATLELLGECERVLRVQTPLRLFTTPAVASPVLHGLWQPRLLLPSGFIHDFSPAELRFVFLHELAHVRRQDIAINWLLTALQIVHWFNPLVWLGFGRMRRDRELACDALALEVSGETQRKAYGETILRLLQRLGHPTTVPDLVGLLEDRRQLRERIRAIAEFRAGRRGAGLAAGLLLGLAAVALTDATDPKLPLSEAQAGLQLRAINGEAEAQVRLARLYCRGEEITQDFTEAMKWFRKAAEQGDVEAQFYLAQMFHCGEGVTQDSAEAAKWYRKAAEQGDAKAQHNLGVAYRYGKGVTKDFTEAAKWYRKAAEQGDADAQFNLGVAYRYGDGVTQDFAEAMKWYRKAAEQANADAQFSLGATYQVGEGVTKDFSEAAKWFRKAAEQGDADAQFNLGVAYRYGKGVTKDFTEAAKWYRKAAEQGDADAQFNLGVAYRYGEGVTQDFTEAAKWFRKAAEQANADAQFNLGATYQVGEGVTQDFTEAAKWFRKAADQGDAEAQASLGLMYHHGDGVRMDNVQAYKWLDLAAASGLQQAEKFRDDIGFIMPSQQVAKAQRLAREFRPRPMLPGSSQLKN